MPYVKATTSGFFILVIDAPPKLTKPVAKKLQEIEKLF